MVVCVVDVTAAVRLRIKSAVSKTSVARTRVVNLDTLYLIKNDGKKETIDKEKPNHVSRESSPIHAEMPQGITGKFISRDISRLERLVDFLLDYE